MKARDARKNAAMSVYRDMFLGEKKTMTTRLGFVLADIKKFSLKGELELKLSYLLNTAEKNLLESDDYGYAIEFNEVKNETKIRW